MSILLNDLDQYGRGYWGKRGSDEGNRKACATTMSGHKKSARDSVRERGGNPGKEHVGKPETPLDYSLGREALAAAKLMRRAAAGEYWVQV